MKNTVRCYHCGNEYSDKEVKEIISCGHCHKQMKINEKSEKRFRIVRYLFVLTICLVIAFCMNMATGNNFIGLLITLGIAMLLANSSDKWCLKLTDMVFGLEYEEYTPVKISNKDRIKMENQKKKKGLFKK